MRFNLDMLPLASINSHTVKQDVKSCNSGGYRRRGYALQIIKNLVEYSKENQIDRVDLKATKMGVPVYLKAGFEIMEDTHTIMHFANK